MINIDYLLNLHLIGKKPKKQEENPEEPVLIGKVYGVVIDSGEVSTVETGVNYTDDAIGFESAKGNDGNFSYGSWENRFPFNAIKPCIIKNGIVQFYLNPNDYSKKVDGTDANNDILKGDVVVEFPTIYWNIEKINGKVYVKYSDIKVNSNYQALAHQKGTKVLDNIYIGAYLNSIATVTTANDALKSVSGMDVVTGKSLITTRTNIKKNNDNYESIGYYQLLMLQVLYVVMFRDLNSQRALGKGYYLYNKKSKTGATDDKGLFYGTTLTNQDNVKFCGIEDFYGNAAYFVDGVATSLYNTLGIAVDEFDKFSSYYEFAKLSTTFVNGVIKDVVGTTNAGFVVSEPSTSTSSSRWNYYYCDLGIRRPSTIAYFGFDGESVSAQGVFNLTMNVAENTVSGLSGVVGSRLMCRI